MALNPAIIHSMHVCITCISVEMQTHITCRWSGSAPFVMSLTRVRVWTQLINTKRCQCSLEPAAFSWSRDSDVFVFLCFRLILSDPTKKDHQWCSVHSRPPCLTLHLPPTSLPVTQERVRDSFMSPGSVGGWCNTDGWRFNAALVWSCRGWNAFHSE